MPTVLLKAQLTQDGKPYVTNHGIEYHDMPQDAAMYLLGKAAEITTHVHAHSSSKGRYGITLEGIVDGKAQTPVTKNGLTKAQVRSIERHMTKVQNDMIDNSEMIDNARGKKD